MAVPQADHQSIIIVREAVGDLQQAEVTQAVVPQRMRLVHDRHTVADQGLFDLLQHPVMRNGHPSR
jgi:hypothetical protein